MRAPPLDVLCPILKEASPDVSLDYVHETTPSALIDLPPELLTAICAPLECRTVVRCRAVCRRLRDVIDASLELQYRIELARDGMTDGPCQSQSQPSTSRTEVHSVTATTPASPALTTADRLTRLRQLRHAWHTLHWTRCVTVPMPGPCCAYELVGGLFCKTQPRARREVPSLVSLGSVNLGAGVGAGVDGGGELGGWDAWLVGHGDWDDGFGDGVGAGAGVGGAEAGQGVGTVGLYEFGSRTMSTTWLPGPAMHDRGRTVVRDDLGIPTRDFALDPSQDVMVLFKGGEDAGLPAMAVFQGVLELHIRTISTNEGHPEARVPVLCTPVLYPVTSMFVQIVDDIVGMMYCIDPVRPRITLWNWKTGILVVDNDNLPTSTWDFSFLNSRALLVATGTRSGSLELFTFTCDHVDADADADSDDSTPTPTTPQQRHAPTSTPTSSLVHVATLHLPPVRASVRLLNIGVHTGPYLAACPPGKPFTASNAERIHVLTVQYIHLQTLDGPRTRPKVCLFVHNRALERYLERGVADLHLGLGLSADTDVSEGAAMAVPWREWGRTHTRMLPHLGTFQWLRYVHGQRVVMLLPTPEQGRSTLQVLDFNVCRPLDKNYHDNENDEKDDDDASDSSLRNTILEHVDYPTQIVMPNIFTDVVETVLPYYEARRDVLGDYSGMMIDDERLVGLKYPAFLTGDMKEIDVFTM